MPIYKKGGAKGDCKKPKIWNPNTKRCVNDNKANRNKGAKTATQGVIVIQVPEQGNCGKKTQTGEKDRCTKNGKFRKGECSFKDGKCSKKTKKQSIARQAPAVAVAPAVAQAPAVAVAVAVAAPKKTCPQGKILNPKTNRCINDTPANRKKISIETVNNVEGSHINIMTTQCSSYSNIKDVDISKFKFIDISNKPDSEKCYSEAQLKLMRDALIPAIKAKYTLPPNTEELNKIADKQLKNLVITKLVYDDPVTNKQISLCEQKFLNKGSYGSVYEFYNGNYKVAVKYFKNKNDSELKVIQKLNKLKLDCKTINARVLERGKGAHLEKYAIMEIMHGGLNKMNGKLDRKTIWNVIKDIALHLKCLNDNKLAYTDLKTANVLFKCKNKKEIDIYLGDLGSICNRGQTHVSTWMPWETSRGWVQGVKCNEHTMVWQIAIVFLELVKWRKYTIFSWQTIKDYSAENITRYFNEIIRLYKLDTLVFKDNENSKFKNAGELFRGMVEFNPKKRCKLIDITTSIKL